MPLMVMVLSAQAAVTPEGKPVGVPIPVATEVLCVILVNGVLIQTVGVLEAALTVLFGDTVNETALLVPFGVVTTTLPEVALVGTVKVILVAVTSLKAPTIVSFMVTKVAPANPIPAIETVAPTQAGLALKVEIFGDWFCSKWLMLPSASPTSISSKPSPSKSVKVGALLVPTPIPFKLAVIKVKLVLLAAFCS